MSDERWSLIDADGNRLAELQIVAAEGNWYTGKLMCQQLPPMLKEALDRYDEVIVGQMLSYLDGATSAIEQFGLHVREANGTAHKVYSLHINPAGDVSFRTSPVPPPAWMTKSACA